MISIIGAGPAGSYTGYLLAKNGYDVNIYEEHREIGKPIQCSGVITSALDSLIKIKKNIIINKIKKVRFYSPDGNFFEVNIKPDYVFDRSLFDKYIASMAEDEGVIFKTKKFLDLDQDNNKIKLRFNDGYAESERVIGADGPYSKVASSVGLMNNRKYITGVQARAEIKDHDKEIVDIFLGYGEFGWLIPESEYTARIGVVSEKNPNKDFEKLMHLCNAKLINFQSGMIPLYSRKQKTQKKNVYLIGDAAAQVKASTHGGILYSMIAGKALTNSIKQNKNYEKLWKKEIGLDLWLNLKIRDTLLKFSKEDYNTLVKYFSNNKLNNILGSHVRDFPSRFIIKTLIAEPRLLRYALKSL